MSDFSDSLAPTRFVPPKMSWAAWFLAVAAGSGAVAYGVYLNDYVIAATAAVALLSALTGFRMGLTRVGASLAAFTAAFMFAPQLGVTYESHFSQWFGTTGLLNRCVAVGTVGIVIFLVAALFMSAVASRILRSRPRLAWINSWLGFGTGAAQGALIVLIVLGGLLVVEPMQLQLANQDAGPSANQRPETAKKMTEAILLVTDHTHSSKLGSTIEKYNPFEHFEPLKKFEQVQQSVRVLSNPAKIDGLMRHPAINKLKERPEIKQAVANLMDDPEIREVLRGGATIQADQALQLLSHPAVLELIDQPDFVEEATRIIHEASAQEVNQI